MSREALESLIDSPGFALFKQHVAREWGQNGARYTAEMEKALNLTDNNAAASQARQIVAARKTIENLMHWPEEELARLQRAEQTPAHANSMSRRGGL